MFLAFIAHRKKGIGYKAKYMFLVFIAHRKKGIGYKAKYMFLVFIAHRKNDRLKGKICFLPL